MAIIFTYPTKVTPALADTVVITDSESEDPEDRTKQISIASIKDTINVVDSLNALTGAVTITGGTNVTLTTSGNNIAINSSGGGGGTVGPGTVNKLSMFTTTTTIGDSIVTQDSGPGITIAGNMAVASGGYISTPNILDDAGEFGSASQVLSKSSDNSSILWSTPTSTVGITGSVQYRKSDGSFQGTTDLLFSDDGNGRSTLKVGNNAIGQVGELQVEGGDDGPGIIKLNGENKTYYTNISGNDNGTENYTIKLPNSGPTGNNKILESTSTGVLSWINTPASSPVGISGSVQFRSSTGTFNGNSELTYNGSGGLTVGEGGGNGGVITLIAEDGTDSGLLKIGHLDNTEYLSLGLGDDAMAASYSIDFPTSAPGGNNKILESTSAGVLSWINTPSGTSYSAGDGLDLTGTTFSTDLKANGGLVIQSTELALDLGASAITGILSGNSLSLISTTNPGTNHSVLMGNGDDFVETGDSETAIQLPVGTTERRPAASATNVGLMRYNSQTANFEVCKQTTSSSGQYSWYTINVTIITE